jgi:glycosyltransferase involved in cell wall biosynthesis
MKNLKVLHFIYGDLAFNNFLYPLITFNEGKLLSQEVVIGGRDLSLDVFKTKKGKGLHYGYNFQLRSLNVSFLKLFKLILRKSPSIIVAHMSLYATYPLIISKLLKVEKRIYLCHGAPYLGYSGPLKLGLKILEKINISLSTMTICVSPSIHNELKKIAKNANIIAINPGSSVGLSPEKYLTKQGFLVKLNDLQKRTELRVLYVGRGYRRKGIFDLINAFSSQSILEKKIRLDIVGFKQSNLGLDSNTLPDNIIFHGFQKNVSSFYQDNDIVILPSWHEGFGYTLLEGAANGCAMVGSRIPGPDSLIINNYNGRLLPVKSSKEIENYLLNYYNNRSILLSHMQNAYLKSFEFQEEAILTEVSDLLTRKK